MSGFLSGAAALTSGVNQLVSGALTAPRTGWLARLRPGSFRGAAFHIESHQETGGRRIDVREYPQRDTPSTEDLGRTADGYRIRVFVIAALSTNDYIDARDALRKACRASGPGTLVHPYLGSVSVNCRSCTMREQLDQGGVATFDLDFIESGLTPSPSLSQNTSSSALAGLGSLLSIAVQAYAIGSLIAQRPGVLLGFAEAYLGNVVTGLTGLPPTIVTQIAGAISGITSSLAAGTAPVTSAITGLVGDPVAIAVTDTFSAAATAVIAQATATTSAAPDPVAGTTSSLARMPADPTQGLLPLASFSTAGLATPAGVDLPLQQMLAQQVQALVCGAATIAIAQIYASTDWLSSNAAATAKETLLDLLDAQALSAAAADQDALYQGWLGITGLATADLVQRAQSLPSLKTYNTLVPMPSDYLAQLLYQDGSQADSLVALNDAVHPSFMPVSGLYLANA